MSYLLLYQYIAHWLLLCYGIMMLLSYTTVDFYLFNLIPSNKKSCTLILRWPLRPVGLLFVINNGLSIFILIHGLYYGFYIVNIETLNYYKERLPWLRSKNKYRFLIPNSSPLFQGMYIWVFQIIFMYFIFLLSLSGFFVNSEINILVISVIILCRKSIFYPA